VSLAALRIDFVRPSGGRSAAALALLGAGALAAAVAFVNAEQAREEAARWEQKLEDTRRLARRALPSFAPEEAPSEDVSRELRAANAVIEQLALPWDGLFRDVESAVTPDVALLSAQPDPKNRRVILGGEARDLNGLLTFIARLEASPGLRDAHLTQHEVRANEPRRPIAFQVQVSWQP
jgi:Tfp pilus assembly protein PilN